MRFFRRIRLILWRTGATKIFFAYIIVLCISGFIMMIMEPQVNSYFEGLYFCFVASSTIGFGDIVPVTIIGRITTVIVTILGILTAAIIPGIIVSYHTEYLQSKEKETISTFLEKLEHLPDLSKEELEELSQKVKQYNKKYKLKKKK